VRDDESRTAPSAGGIYPVQLHVAVGDINGVKPGCYSYAARTHSLNPVQTGDLRSAIAATTIDPSDWISTASCLVIASADFNALHRRFGSQPPAGERSRRYGYIEIGAVTQNILLAAESLGRSSVIVGGFDDQHLRDAIRLDDNLSPVAIVPI